MWAVGGRPTLPISTDHKCWGAPSFALLRRVGSKALDQLQRRCPCCCLSFLPVLFACHPVEPALSEVEWGSAVVVACPSFRPQKAKALNQPQRRCPCRCPSFLPHPKIVISTEAAHALCERRGGEPPHFAFAVAPGSSEASAPRLAAKPLPFARKARTRREQEPSSP